MRLLRSVAQAWAYVMSRPIKDTPILTGEDARRFERAMKAAELSAMIQGVGKYRHIDNETVLRAINEGRKKIPFAWLWRALGLMK